MRAKASGKRSPAARGVYARRLRGALVNAYSSEVTVGLELPR